MNTNSNSYTIIYASVIVVIVAFLLAFVSSSLKSIQDENVKIDTKKQILAALHVRGVDDVNSAYEQHVKSDMLMNADGTLEEYAGELATNYEKEAKEEKRLHVFVCEVEGQTKYIIPVYGAGLWGPLWGYVALNEDKNTIYGANFSHASETPGLGAEISTEAFQREFTGKHTLAQDAIALGVTKYGKVEQPDFQVDGISGGTITSVGVNDMLKSSLSSYLVFLTKE